MEKTVPFDFVAAISQWPSHCLCQRCTVDILTIFSHGFMVQCVNLMLSKFLHL